MMQRIRTQSLLPTCLRITLGDFVFLVSFVVICQHTPDSLWVFSAHFHIANKEVLIFEDKGLYASSSYS